MPEDSGGGMMGLEVLPKLTEELRKPGMALLFFLLGLLILTPNPAADLIDARVLTGTARLAIGALTFGAGLYAGFGVIESLRGAWKDRGWEVRIARALRGLSDDERVVILHCLETGDRVVLFWETQPYVRDLQVKGLLEPVSSPAAVPAAWAFAIPERVWKALRALSAQIVAGEAWEGRLIRAKLSMFQQQQLSIRSGAPFDL